MTQITEITATVDVEAVRERLLGKINTKSFGWLAGQGVLAIDGLKQENERLRALIKEALDYESGEKKSLYVVTLPEHLSEKMSAVIKGTP